MSSRRHSRESGASDGTASLGTSEAILVAARSVALDVGFRRATVADVARRAGVSRMTIYREYPQIAALWSRLLTDELVGLLGEARDATCRLPGARERIVAMAVVMVERVPEHPLFRRALDTDPDVLLPLIVTRFGSSQRAAIDELVRLVDAGQDDGSVRADLDPQAAAVAVLLVTQSYIFSARAIDGCDRPAAVRAQLPALLAGYLTP